MALKTRSNSISISDPRLAPAYTPADAVLAAMRRRHGVKLPKVRSQDFRLNISAVEEAIRCQAA